MPLKKHNQYIISGEKILVRFHQKGQVYALAKKAEIISRFFRYC